MKASDDLFKLIKGLNKAEKRFFKLYASRYDTQDKNNYMRLFDYVERQDEYDEAQLKEYFRHENFIRHLPSEKNYLYNMVLDSLQSHHSEAGEEQKLKKKIAY